MSSNLPEPPSVVADCRTIQLSKIPDQRGNLTFIEGGKDVPFEIRRTYWVYDVPGGEFRGGHANRQLQEFFIALSGSFDISLEDGIDQRVVSLNRSYYGLYVPSMIWRHIRNFSTNAVCLVLASAEFADSDYMRDYEAFVRLRRG
jgi:hypothetical protein